MVLRPTVSGKRFKLHKRTRSTLILRVASIFLLAVALIFIFHDVRATSLSKEPLVPIDDSPIVRDPEFADLPGVKAPLEAVANSNSYSSAAQGHNLFADGLEVGADAHEWTKEDGPRPIPLPPRDAPVKLPKPSARPLLRQSTWNAPRQPTNDMSRKITTEDLQPMFGVLPTNRTLIDQRLIPFLQGYDIRRDNHFILLAQHENLTDIYARYHHMVRRGWGSVLPTDPYDVHRDHLYHVRHSGDTTKGYGVYASIDIPRSTILGSYGGELLKETEMTDGQYAWDAPSMTLFDPSTGTWTARRMVIEASRVGNLLRFINDLGNELQNVDATWVPIDNRWNLFYYTTKDIWAGSELSISYGDSYWNPDSTSSQSDMQYQTETVAENRKAPSTFETDSTHSALRVEGRFLEAKETTLRSNFGGEVSLETFVNQVDSTQRTTAAFNDAHMPIDLHGGFKELHPVSSRKVPLRKQYFKQPERPLHFAQSPVESHASGSRYS